MITAPPYFAGWLVSAPHRNRYSLEQREGVRVRRCPLWVPRRPSGLTRLLHLVSFALSSLGPLLAQRHWRPDVVITVAPAFFCAPGALLLRRFCGRRTFNWLHIRILSLMLPSSWDCSKGGCCARWRKPGSAELCAVSIV